MLPLHSEGALIGLASGGWRGAMADLYAEVNCSEPSAASESQDPGDAEVRNLSES